MIDGSIQRAEQEAVSSQNLAETIGNMSRTRTGAAGKPFATEERRETVSEELDRQHTSQMVLRARSEARGWREIIQRITKETCE